MKAVFDANAPKQATNLSVNADLIRQAKELDIKISTVTEAALAEAVRQKLEERWLQENTEAFAAYNESVRESGVFSDHVRLF